MRRPLFAAPLAFVALTTLAVAFAITLASPLGAKPRKGPTKIPWPKSAPSASGSASPKRGAPPSSSASSKGPTRIASGDVPPPLLPIPEPTRVYTRASTETVVARVRGAQRDGGSVVVLVTWATWCPSCASDLATLDDVARRYGPLGARIVVVSTDESEETLDRFLRLHPLRADVLWCASGPSTDCDGARIAQLLGGNATRSVPSTRIFRKAGGVDTEWTGSQPIDAYARVLDRLVRE